MGKKEDMVISSRQRFFSKQVHQGGWKENMSGANEGRVLEVLESLGFKIGIDFVRQYPIGERFVIDFAFVDLRVAIEVDSDNHNTTKQKQKDEKRDSYLFSNGWVSLRVKDRDFFNSYKMSFYKNLIKEVVLERRKQYENGELYYIEIPNFKDEDYD